MISRRQWRWAGVAGLALVLLGVGEFSLRQLPTLLPTQWQIRLHERTRKHRVVAHDTVGFLLRPNQREIIRNQDYQYVKQTDDHGFPNQVWPQQADIVFLGDSLITGEGVGFTAQFTTLIDQRLPDQRVANIGVPGAGPERQYQIYRHFGNDLGARLVVTCWYLMSDLDNDTHFYAWLENPGGMDYNWFRLTYRQRQNPLARFDPRRMWNRSVLVAWGRETLTGWVGGVDSSRYPGRYRRVFPDGTELLFNQQKLPFISREVAPTDARIERAFTSLQRLQNAAQSRRASVAVMLIPSKEELFAQDAKRPVNNVVARVRQRFDALSLPVLDLYDMLRQNGAYQPPFFSRDSHLNQHGHRLVAEYFVAWWQMQGN